MSLWGRGGREFNTLLEKGRLLSVCSQVARRFQNEASWWVRCPDAVGGWWKESSVNLHSDLDYLLIFAKGAILWIIKGQSLFFFLASLCVLIYPSPRYQLWQWALLPRVTDCPSREGLQSSRLNSPWDKWENESLVKLICVTLCYTKYLGHPETSAQDSMAKCCYNLILNLFFEGLDAVLDEPEWSAGNRDTWI